MKKWFDLPIDLDKAYTQLAADNAEALQEFNRKMMSVLSLMGGSLMALSLLFLPARLLVPRYLGAHLAVTLMLFLLNLIFTRPAFQTESLLGLYIGYSVFFIYALYLSIFFGAEAQSTVLVGVFCIMPMGFIDRPVRMNAFSLFWFILYSALSALFKPLFGLSDTISVMFFAILSCFLGNITVRARLESFDARRLLTIERDTDVLTGLYNRRKLMSALQEISLLKHEKPSGILMMDIDRFKLFNDTYGHIAGDECLAGLGEALLGFARGRRMDFYRYGGEEFIGIIWDQSEDELMDMAEGLRAVVEGMHAGGTGITVSIGVVYCGGRQISDYQQVIAWADRASYTAKHCGRNKVCMEVCDQMDLPADEPAGREVEESIKI